jgi:hypothetical protein
VLYDAFGRPIPKRPHLFGFGRVPEREPARIKREAGYSESGCADAIGFAEFATEEPGDDDELLEIECKKERTCVNSSRL